MKLFKKIYFPVIAALIIFATVFSLIEANGLLVKNVLSVDALKGHIQRLTENGARNSSSSKTKALDYIESQLSAAGLNEVIGDVNSNGYNTAPLAQGTIFTRQTAVLNSMEMRDYFIGSGIYDDTIFVDRTINNIIVLLPGSEGAQTVAITAHYDSAASTNGAAANALSVASAIETIKELKGTAHKNNIVFVFCDDGEQSGLGAYAFFEKFIGFNNIVGKTNLAISFDMQGTKGAVALAALKYESGKLVASASKAGIYTTSIYDVFGDTFTRAGGFLASEMPSLNVVASGGKENYNTANDNAANLKTSLIKQNAAAVFGAAQYYGDNSLAFDQEDTDFVFFKYAGVISIMYPVLAAMILLALIVGFIGAAVGINFRVNAYDWKKTGFGALAALLSVVATVVTIFALYMLFGLILSGYGVFSIRYIFELGYSSTGLIIAALMTTITSMIGYGVLFKKLFALKATEIAAGNTIITAILAIVLGFIIPKAAFPVVALATLLSAVLFVSVLLKNKFREKFGFDINRLMLNFVPVIICLPLFVSAAVALGASLGVVFYPLIFGCVALLVGSVSPFFVMLDPIFAKLAKKLPHRSVRIIRYYDESIPDPQRKGKTITKQKKEVVREKRPFGYKHWFVVSVLSLICVVLIVSFSIGGNAHTNFSKNEISAFYENALVYHFDSDSNNGTWTVKDLGIYKYVQRSLSDYTWDSEQRAYVKTNISDSDKNNQFRVTATSTQKVLSITPYDTANSSIVLDFEFSIRPSTLIITVGNNSNREILRYTGLVSDTLRVVVPQSSHLDITVADTDSISAVISYSEMNTLQTTVNDYREWTVFKEFYKDSDVISNISPRLLITKTINFSA